MHRRIYALILILLLSLLPSRSWAVPAFSQQATPIHATTGTTAAFGAMTISGADTNVMLWVNITNSCGGTCSSWTFSVADNNGGTWHEVHSPPIFGSANVAVDQWYSPAHATGSTTVTITSSATITALGAQLAEFTGIANASPVDVSNSALNNNATQFMQTGTMTSTVANDMLIGGGGTGNALVPPTDYGGSGGSPTALTTNSTTIFTYGAYQLLSSTGTYGLQWCFNNAGSCGTTTIFAEGLGAAFKPSVAATSQAGWIFRQ